MAKGNRGICRLHVFEFAVKGPPVGVNAKEHSAVSRKKYRDWMARVAAAASDRLEPDWHPTKCDEIVVAIFNLEEVEFPGACSGSDSSGLRLLGRRLCDTPELAPGQFILEEVEFPGACSGSDSSGLRLLGRRLCDTPELAPGQFIYGTGWITKLRC